MPLDPDLADAADPTGATYDDAISHRRQRHAWHAASAGVSLEWYEARLATRLAELDAFEAKAKPAPVPPAAQVPPLTDEYVAAAIDPGSPAHEPGQPAWLRLALVEMLMRIRPEFDADRAVDHATRLERFITGAAQA